jgi:hypothetical protein
MTVFVMFFIELMAARFDIFGDADLEADDHDPARELVRRTSTAVHDKYTDEALKEGECLFFSSLPFPCISTLKPAFISPCQTCYHCLLQDRD